MCGVDGAVFVILRSWAWPGCELIRRNGRRMNMSNAVRRWQREIDCLMLSKGEDVKRVKIDRVFLTKRKW